MYLLSQPEDVTSLLSVKLATKYAQLRDVESMRAIARAHQNRNLADFEKALKDYQKGQYLISLTLEGHSTNLVYGIQSSRRILRFELIFPPCMTLCSNKICFESSSRTPSWRLSMSPSKSVRDDKLSNSSMFRSFNVLGCFVLIASFQVVANDLGQSIPWCFGSGTWMSDRL